MNEDEMGAESTGETDEPLTASDMPLPGGDFRLFVQKLAYQALIGLGVLDNPITQTRDRNLANANSVVDDLRMLQEKTRGNLAPDEQEHIDSVLKSLDQHLAAPPEI